MNNNAPKPPTNLPTGLLWAIAVGAGASGVSGVSGIGQLSSLQDAIVEQARVAELRGQLSAQIAGNQRLIAINQESIKAMISRDTSMGLHNSQQSLIDKLIDFAGEVASKEEIAIIVNKMNNLEKRISGQ